MKKHFIVTLLLFPLVVSAQVEVPEPVKKLIGVLSTKILNPIIAVMFAIALASFMYGIVAYIWHPDSEELREVGRRSMFWGIVGMFVMVSVFAIMQFLINSIGADPSVMNYV